MDLKDWDSGHESGCDARETSLSCDESISTRHSSEFEPHFRREAPLPRDPLAAICAQEPILPDAVVAFYAERLGIDVEATDPRVIRLVSLAAQKFIADIVVDAAWLNRLRNTSRVPRDQHDLQTCLTMSVLNDALEDHGIVEPMKSEIQREPKK
ncbi:hypothetical protein L596_022746 [Steinernema carpocapsae]|uniref:Transcription initiation factor TFIID subunit 10 n=1 Tax=Steinernema carpocapsae TaxID=34508 RepID=A0A4V6XVX8_STECR|nr:hypothetical protein L596_022746 [Steinernema carpocapsae]